MIIRFSVGDNDFQELLEKYANNLFFYLGEDEEELTISNAAERWDMQNRINEILNQHWKEDDQGR